MKSTYSNLFLTCSGNHRGNTIKTTDVQPRRQKIRISDDNNVFQDDLIKRGKTGCYRSVSY